MIVLAILGTLAALAWSLVVFGANSMRSSPGAFEGGGTIAVAWVVCAVFWLAWWVG